MFFCQEHSTLGSVVPLARVAYSLSFVDDVVVDDVVL